MPIMHKFICTLKIVRLVILMWKMKPATNKCVNLYISSGNSTVVKEYDFHILIITVFIFVFLRRNHCLLQT